MSGMTFGDRVDRYLIKKGFRAQWPLLTLSLVEARRIAVDPLSYIGHRHAARALVDTTNCLHYGSRCQKNGRRMAFVVHYTLFNSYSYHYSNDYEDLNMATSPEFRSQIAGDERKALVYHLIPGRN